MSSDWRPVTRRDRCPVCDSSDWCALSTDGRVARCMRITDGPGVRTMQDSEGNDYGLRFLDGSDNLTVSRYQHDPDPPRASPEVLHQVYTALLARLSLSSRHRNGLLARGLTSEAIDALGYRTLPPPGERTAIVRALKVDMGGTIPEAVPGLHRGKLSGAPGLVIPVRDPSGSVVALKIRSDDENLGKYLWLSSARDEGPSPGSPCHVPTMSGSSGSTGVVRITEGPLKADVATHLSGILTLGVAGCHASRSAVARLRALRCEVVRLAWDADARSNPHVARSLRQAARVLREEGFQVCIETWDPSAGKGIDDALAAEASITVHTGEAVDRVVARMCREAGADEPNAARTTKGDAAVAPSPTPPSSPSSPSSPSDDWRSQLVMAGNNVKNTFGNLCKILRSAPEFLGKFRLNEMTQSVEFDGVTMPEERAGQIRERIEDAPWGRFSPGKDTLFDAIYTVAAERKYNPVREYLSSLEWDGERRIERVLAEVLRTTPSPLTQSMIRKWLISAVARAMDPGCKVDTALVLIGDQGLKKSSFFDALGSPWFADTEVKIGDKDGYQQIHASWITEWGELDRVTSQRHAGEVKAFIARRADLFRPPYGRITRNFQRACVIVGSTNNEEFLTDPTGSRRFWCIRVHLVADLELLRTWRDQLWAEAVAAYKAGEKHYLDAQEDQDRAVAAERHRARDIWEDMVERWMHDEWPEISAKNGREYLTTLDVVTSALKIAAKDCRRDVENRVGAVMRALKHTAKRVRLRADEREHYKNKNGETPTFVRAWVHNDCLTGPGAVEADEIEFQPRVSQVRMTVAPHDSGEHEAAGGSGTDEDEDPEERCGRYG